MKRAIWTCLAGLALAVSLGGRAAAEWSEPTVVSPGFIVEADAQEGPDGTLHFVWSDYGPSGNGIYYRQSSDGGATWSLPVLLALNDWGYARVWRCRVLGEANGVVHAVYQYENWFGWAGLYHLRSVDGGRTWTQRFATGGAFVDYPTLRADGEGGIDLAWSKSWARPFYTYFAHSFDDGATWSGPAFVANGSLPYGYLRYYTAEQNAFVRDASGTLHLVWLGGYARSSDDGLTWQLPGTLPAGFSPRGIYADGARLLVVGADAGGRAALVASPDLGATWEAPLPISGARANAGQVLVEPSGAYGVVLDGATYTRSVDGGLTWSSPEYMGPAAHTKLLWTSPGRLLALYTSETGTGFKQWIPPAGVDTPEFLSLWEKSSLRYTFTARGTGTVVASFPSDLVGADPSATVDGAPVATSVALENGRTTVRFPLSTQAWTTCTIPLRVLKGNLSKLDAVATSIAERGAALELAREAADAAAVATADADLQALHRELRSVDRAFEVVLEDAGGRLASDQTEVTIYDSLPSAYAHFKANPPQDGGARLVMISKDTLAVAVGVPFRLEVKVTHLAPGQVATAAVSGGFQVVDAIETPDGASKKTDFFVFYPPNFTAGSDTIDVSVTVDGVTTTAPLAVLLR